LPLAKPDKIHQARKTKCRTASGFWVRGISTLSVNPEFPGLIDQLRKLWILDLVVQQGGFQKAALKAKVTRSAISQSVSQLEKLHGKSLLIRDRGNVRATPYCLEVLAKAKPVFESLLHLEPTGLKIPAMTWLDLGAFESLAISIMPRLLRVLEKKCPGIKVTVKVGRSGKLAGMVRRGELCMAIVIENDLLSGLTVIPVADDRLGLFASSAVTAELRSWDAVEKLPLGALVAGPDGQPGYFTKFSKALNLTRKVSFSSDSLEALLAAACHGSIVAILPARVARRGKSELVEITPPEIIKKRLGHHRICLISQKNCDPAENDFLAAEIKILLNSET
jgi:DNA-binding transcriptional LysR family regulator